MPALFLSTYDEVLLQRTMCKNFLRTDKIDMNITIFPFNATDTPMPSYIIPPSLTQTFAQAQYRTDTWQEFLIFACQSVRYNSRKDHNVMVNL